MRKLIVLVLIIAFFSSKHTSKAFGEVELSSLFDPKITNQLLEIYEPRLQQLFEEDILRVMTAEEREIAGLTGVTATLDKVAFMEFPKTGVDPSGTMTIPLYTLAFLDDYVLASLAQHSMHRDTRMPTSYLFYLSCPNLVTEHRSAVEFLGLPDDLTIDNESREFANVMLQTLALWLMAYEAGKSIIPAAPEEFALELFRRMGLPPFGLSVLMFTKTLSSGFDVSPQEIATGTLDEATISDGRDLAVGYTRVLRLLHESSMSLSRVPGAENWKRQEAARLSTIKTKLEDGTLLDHFIHACATLAEQTGVK